MSIDYSQFAIPKPSHNRNKKKRVNRSRFSSETILKAFERDNYQCVKCGRMDQLESIPHHIIFRSQMGEGTLRNAATVCIYCHKEAHENPDVRKWFEDWQESTLDQDGYRKF